MPDRLREISGLALTKDERLLAVTDEAAIVYELDYEDGRLTKTFALGEPTLRGDFEGIAVLDSTVWLMTSDGTLFSAAEGSDGQRVAYQRHVTGLEDECEFEGLAAIEERDALALICKDARKKKDLRVFEWKPGDEDLRSFVLPEGRIEDAIGSKRVNPSGIVRDVEAGDWIVVAAIQQAIFRVGDDGEFIDVIMRLDPDRHRQAEGIEKTRDGRLLVADEGGNGRAALSVYRMNDGNQ